MNPHPFASLSGPLPVCVARATASLLLGAALALLPAPAQAASFEGPKRRSGLWEIETRTDTSRSTPIVVKQCVDSKTDDLFRKFGENSKQITCAKNDMKREGNTITVDTECTMGKSLTKSHAVYSGDFETGYSGEGHVTYEPALMGISRATITTTAKWLGPCLAGQKPGDVVMPSGQTMNLNDLPGAK